jgi:chloride channel protein, CIC family
MTEKLARRGTSLRTEYAVDYLAHVVVRDEMSTEVATLRTDQTVGEAREWLASGAPGTTHQGFPVLDLKGLLVGVLTRRDLIDPSREGAIHLGDLVRRPAVVVFEDNTLRDAADQMVIEEVGRLPVVRRDAPRKVVGIVSRSDLLAAHAPRLQAAREARRLRMAFPFGTSREA